MRTQRACLDSNNPGEKMATLCELLTGKSAYLTSDGELFLLRACHTAHSADRHSGTPRADRAFRFIGTQLHAERH